jgi:hypothetical protein
MESVVSGDVIICRRALGGRVLAAISAIAAVAGLAYSFGVSEKDRIFCWLPSFGILTVVLASPLLWRASAGTRTAAVGYLGIPGGMVLMLPFAALPAAIAPYATTVGALTLAAMIFVVHSRPLRYEPREGWLQVGGVG